MEELAEGALKSILRLIGLLVRTLLWLIWELCLETIAWYAGWLVCRLVSFGRLPGVGITQHEQASQWTHGGVCLVGMLSLVGLGILIAQLVGSG